MGCGKFGTSGATNLRPYPGSETEPEDILLLADSYREASLEILAFRKAKGRRMRPADPTLRVGHKKKGPASAGPFSFVH